MKDKIYYLKKELNTYTHSELKDVQAYIAHLLMTFSQKENIEQALEILVALRDACGSLIAWPESPGQFSTVMRRKFYEFVESTNAFLETHCQGIKKSQRIGFLTLLMKLRLKYVQERVHSRKISLTAKSFLVETISWEALVDNNFPGYIQNKSLHLLYPKIKRTRRVLKEGI